MNQQRDGQIDVRNLPRATPQELNEGLIFLTSLIGMRQHVFLSAPVQELLGELSGNSILSGALQPVDGTGMTGVGQLYYQVVSGRIADVFFSPPGSADWITFAGNYRPRYVRDSDVSVGSNSASGANYTITVPEIETYDRGQVVRFRNPVRNNGPVNLRVAGLPFREVLTIREEPFLPYEFHPNYLHSLLYDGDKWLALDEIEIPLHIVLSHDFDFSINAQTGYNLIEITGLDNLVFTGNVAQIMFRMQGTNTGEVEIKFGGGGAVDLLTSRGEQIPAGYLQDGMYVRAVLDIERSVWISDVEGPRDVGTQLVASLDVQAGDYEWGQWFGPWVLEPGIAGMFVYDLTGGQFRGNPNDVPSGYVGHLRDRLRDSQLGWLLEARAPNGDVLGSVMILFGDFEGISSVLYRQTGAFSFTFQYSFEAGTEGSGWLHVFNGGNFGSTTTYPTGYTINLYLTDN